MAYKVELVSNPTEAIGAIVDSEVNADAAIYTRLVPDFVLQGTDWYMQPNIVCKDSNIANRLKETNGVYFTWEAEPVAIFPRVETSPLFVIEAERLPSRDALPNRFITDEVAERVKSNVEQILLKSDTPKK